MPNLIIMVATMYLLRFCILFPLLRTYGLHNQINGFNFFLLVFSTVLLASAGYIINDLHDLEKDKINKPEKIIIGKYIQPKSAENMNIVLNSIAIAIGIYLSYSIGIRSVSLAFILVAGLLYFYSTTYKGILILGNVIVAFFAALVPMMVLLFELPLLKTKYKFFESTTFNFNFLIWWFGYYALFAFLISLVREIIKDIEDFEGDSAYGQKTLPVAFGIKISKSIVLTLLLIILILISYLLINYINDPISLIYFVTLVIIPIIYIIFIIFNASEKRDYTKASLYCKLIMLTGIIYSFVLKFILFNNY